MGESKEKKQNIQPVKETGFASTSGITKASFSSNALQDYMHQHTPAIAGLPHTAPIYSEMEVRSIPVPDGCMSIKYSSGRHICKCNTDQGTIIHMSETLCENIVGSNGYYNAYAEPQEYDPNYSYNIGLNNSTSESKETSSR